MRESLGMRKIYPSDIKHESFELIKGPFPAEMQQRHVGFVAFQLVMSLPLEQ